MTNIPPRRFGSLAAAMVTPMTEAGDIDDVDQPLGPAHRVLLGSHIYIIENICNVAEIGSVRCQLIAVPLCIREGTGSPLRLLAVTD